MYSALFFTGKLKPSEPIHQIIGEPTLVLDFALDTPVEIDGRPLTAGLWRLSHANGPEREIKGTGMGGSNFFSVLLHKNPYTEFKTERIQQEGKITSSMGYPLLKLISYLYTRTEGSHKERWVPAYIRLLLAEIRHEPLKKSIIRFAELKTIFDAVEELQTTFSDFPAASELIVKTGIPKFRFEKGCQALYGQPIKKIIQHLKMKRGFEEMVTGGKKLQSTYTQLGYDHSENFTTAFHKHFGITPLRAVKFHQS